MLHPLNTPNRNVCSILARSGDLSISYTEMCFDIDLTRDLTDTVFDQRVVTRMSTTEPTAACTTRTGR